MSVLLQGWGTPFRPLTAGYGAAAAALSPGVVVRETFRVPLPDGSVALRADGRTGAPSLGSAEAGIAFALDFSGWMAASEALSSLSAAVWAAPAPGQAGYMATPALLESQQSVGSLAIVTLHAALPRTSYHVICSVVTTAGRTLACRMPAIWCPD